MFEGRSIGLTVWRVEAPDGSVEEAAGESERGDESLGVADEGERVGEAGGRTSTGGSIALAAGVPFSTSETMLKAALR